MMKEGGEMPINGEELHALAAETGTEIKILTKEDEATVGPAVMARAEAIAQKETAEHEDSKWKKLKEILTEELVRALLKLMIKVAIGGILGVRAEGDVIETLGIENEDQETKNKMVYAVGRAALKNRDSLKDMSPAEFMASITEELDNAKNESVANWKNWYDHTAEGRVRWRQILAEAGEKK